jgi:hypothetical protein
MTALPPKADSSRTSRYVRKVPCVDGSGLARRIFTLQAWVGAAMCSAFRCGSHDRWRSPCLLMPPSRSLPPLECCFGTSPIQAEKLRPDRKVLGSATLATRAVASIGPTPWRCHDRRSSIKKYSRHPKCGLGRCRNRVNKWHSGWSGQYRGASTIRSTIRAVLATRPKSRHRPLRRRARGRPLLMPTDILLRANEVIE